MDSAGKKTQDKKVVVTIEARTSSTRLPRKILLEACGKTILEHVVERLLRVSNADAVVVATTVNPADDEIESLCTERGYDFFRGSENDVLGRLIDAGKAFNADILCQTTSDCPLIDPEVCERAIDIFLRSDVDYVSNRLKRTYPTGIDPQVFSLDVLERVGAQTSDPDDREHGSTYIYHHPEQFRLKNFTAPDDLHCPEKRWLLDYPEDFEFIRSVYEGLYNTNPDFTMYDVLAFLREHSEIERMNDMYPVDLTPYHFHEEA